MSIGVGEVLTALELVKSAIDIYKEITKAPEEIKQLNKELVELTKPLESLLSHFQAHAGSRSDAALRSVTDRDREDLADAIHASLQDCGEIKGIFADFAAKRLGQIGDVSLKTKFGFVASAYYKFGDGADTVKALILRIRERQIAIHTYLQLIQVKLLDEANKNIKSLGDKIDQLRRDAEKKNAADKAMTIDMINQIKKLLAKELAEAKRAETEKESSKKDAIKVDKLPVRSKTPEPLDKTKLLPPPENNKHHKRRLSAPSAPAKTRTPSPKPNDKTYSVLFVDPYNVGRSLVSQGILLLIDAWLREKTGKKYAKRIEKVSSAGFFIRRGGDCHDEIEGLSYAHGTYKFDLADDKEKNPAALRALFDETAARCQGAEWRYGRGATEKYAKLLAEMRPTGIKRSHFRDYDYILCFTNREYSNLHKLRSAIVAKDGGDAFPNGKAKILQLGRWLPKKDNSQGASIYAVPPDDMGEDEAVWSAKIDEIKMAIDGFLKKRLHVSYPEKAGVAQG
ncbi:hypothetical protein MGG_01372 [Pyricularia oryzae 70-15]|uniref:Uncharacterized protein n=3 Tax=Pyricularia oryzae TaxID=318829 RepID=G4MZ33_PYRO7|nr:uncharacterized protein MGG_01372 [Pyricularia oryzae 70-15]EHA54500.1 hypothetical protein MGG_01372 [Pyricularia oryzae 70-15]ELQ41973.1 hypothetical protein OOU_Y34scaffold00245g24 [Pyricularia oryzae Y34]KAI7931799.1 hypothetical protein M9X92_000117 [Pyricularia oryzae]KAI7932714.1 hypothetical protein M0657_000023 [Pyricularia oryzae]